MVGINTAMIGRAQGLCFAIGVDTAVDVTARLMRDGRVRRARLGLAGQTTLLDARLARRLHREGDTAVLVMRGHRRAPAARARPAPGRRDPGVRRRQGLHVDDLHRLLTAEIAGTEVELVVIRRARSRP